MSRARTLKALCAALRGEADERTDWMALMAMANAAQATPALFAPLKGLAERGGPVPDDVLTFLADVEARNRRRTDLLLAQLGDAAAALNGAGIVPAVFKGGALALVHEPYRGARMLADMDLLVDAAQVEPAIAALVGAGFELVERYPGADVHCVAELGRGQDPGLLDLHQRPAGPPAAAHVPDIARHSRSVKAGKGQVLFPSPALLIFFTVLHDQLHDGDFWRGAVDLRHLMDFAVLCDMEVDWDHFDALCQTRLIRHAAYAQVLAAARLVGAKAPPRVTKNLCAQAHYRRSMGQNAVPALSVPLGLAAMLAEAPNIRAHRRFDRAGRAEILSGNVNDGPKEGRLGRLLHVFDAEKAGKV